MRSLDQHHLEACWKFRSLLHTQTKWMRIWDSGGQGGEHCSRAPSWIWCSPKFENRRVGEAGRAFWIQGPCPTLSASGPDGSPYPTPALYSRALWGSFTVPLCHTLPSRHVTLRAKDTHLCCCFTVLLWLSLNVFSHCFHLLFIQSLFLNHLLCVRDCPTLKIQRWTEQSETLRGLTVWGGTCTLRGNPALNINLTSYLRKSPPSHPVCTDLWLLTFGVIRIWNCKPPSK